MLLFISCHSYMKKETALYKGCASEGCNKKVIEESTGYRCEKCQKDFQTFSWVLMVSLSVCDATGQTWLTCFRVRFRLWPG